MRTTFSLRLRLKLWCTDNASFSLPGSYCAEMPRQYGGSVQWHKGSGAYLGRGLQKLILVVLHYPVAADVGGIIAVLLIFDDVGLPRELGGGAQVIGARGSRVRLWRRGAAGGARRAAARESGRLVHHLVEPVRHLVEASLCATWLRRREGAELGSGGVCGKRGCVQRWRGGVCVWVAGGSRGGPFDQLETRRPEALEDLWAQHGRDERKKPEKAAMQADT